MCEAINKYSNGLLELNFRADVSGELIEAMRALKAEETAAVGLGFQFWIRHEPRFLDLLTPDFLSEVWDEFMRLDDAVDGEVLDCPLKPEDFLHPPVIDDDNQNNEFLRLFPLIFRAFGQPERYREPLATWGIEFSSIGWMQIMDPFFRFLEAEAVALKSHGFADGMIPLLAQVKEKMGSIRVYIEQIPRLIAVEVRQRCDALDEASSRTCSQCGAPGTERWEGWIRVMCDACEAKQGRQS
jgi:hypothetical protein